MNKLFVEGEVCGSKKSFDRAEVAGILLGLMSVEQIGEIIKRRIFTWEDCLFDLRFGTDTNRIIKHVNVDSPYVANSTIAQSVWCRNIRVLVNEARKRGFGDSLFLGIGCGKGRPCLYASQYNFAKLKGFDFSQELVDSAKRNQLKSKQFDKIDFFVADAGTYRVPDEKVLLFLFNPFDDTVLNLFIDNNMHLRNKAMIAYANDVHRDVLAVRGMKCVFSQDHRRISLWSF